MSDDHISRENLEDILGYIGQGVIYQEADGRIRFFNLAAQRIFGVSAEEARARTSHHPQWRLVYEDGSPCPGDEHPSMITLRSGQTLTDQVRGIAKPDLPVIWLSIDTRPVFRPGQALPRAVVISFSEITRRKRAEEELKASEEKFAKAFQHSPMLMTISRLEDGLLVDANEAFCRASGWSRQEALGKTGVELGWITAEDRARLLALVKKQGRLPDTEYVARARDGRPVHCLFSGEIVSIGGRDMFLVVAQDISERKRAEEALRAQSATLEAIFANAPYVMLLVDRMGRVRDVNRAGVVVAGREKEAILGLLGGEIFNCLNSFDGVGCGNGPHCVDCSVRSRVDSTFATGQAIFSEEGGLDVVRDGRTMHRDLLISTSLMQIGREDLVLVSLVDITERKQMEAELRAGEERFRQLYDHAPIAYQSLDPEGLILDVNQVWLDTLGYERQEVLGRWFGSFLREDFVPHFEKNFPCFKEAGAIRGVEFQMRRKDGSTALVSFNGAIAHDAAGRMIRSHCVFQDITERRRMEEARIKSEEKFHLAFDTSPDAININRLSDGLYVEINQGFTGITGFTAQDVMGKTSLELNIWADPADREKLVQGLREKGYYENLEAKFRKKNGGLLTGLMSARVIAINDEPHIVTVTRDISERIRAEEEKAQLEAQLRQAQKMEAVGTLAGGIAHDFNNILGAVLGFAEMARDDAREGRADPEDLEQIMASAQRAKELVKQILTFSRKNEPTLQPMSLNQAVERVRGILGRTLPKMIEIRTRLAPGLPPVQADPVQMEQVLLNLASNASHAMPGGGALTLATDLIRADEEFRRLRPEVPPGDYVMLQVSDSGQGMDQATREHIFEPFFTTKGVGQGTGLGLSSVYGIVKNHQGYISCQSEPGRGTSFHIYLPVLALEQPPALPDREADEAALRGQETILLVDDERTLRDLAGRTLSGAGYRVLAASSGEEALALYRDQSPPPDLVLMDLGMPGMGGHKAVQEMLALNPQARIVIASGYAADKEVQASLEAGAAGHLAKPFRRGELLATVRRVLDQGRA